VLYYPDIGSYLTRITRSDTHKRQCKAEGVCDCLLQSENQVMEVCVCVCESELGMGKGMVNV